MQADLYGHHTFVGDGFKVVEKDGAYQVSQGVAIIGGLRVELKAPEVIHPGSKPIGVWVDVHRAGSLLSEHQNHFTIITSVADLADHVDSNSYQHYVAKLATVLADGTIEDGRGEIGSTSGLQDTFALWKRSMAEAGYDLIGQFGTEMTIETAEQVVLSKDGKEVYAWLGELPKFISAKSTSDEDGWISKNHASLTIGLEQPVTWSGFDGGADKTGAAASDAAFAAADKNAMRIPSGIYKLNEDWRPTDENASINADADVLFTGAKPNFTGLIPFQGGPIWSGRLFKKTYKINEWANFGNIFQSAHYATSEIPDAPRGGANVVALYSGADAKGAGSSVWAANFVAYANNKQSSAIGIELNYGSLVNGGLGYGLLVASSGSFEAQSGVQIQTNNANSRMKQAIRFNNRSFGLASDYLIGCSGDETTSPANTGLDFSRHSFPAAEISTKSFLVQNTKPNTVSRLSVAGAASGGSPGISADSTDANVNIAISTKGNGQLLINTNNSEGFRVAASGQPDSLLVNQGTGSALLGARGSSDDVSIHLAPKGSGSVRLQSHLSLSGPNQFTCATAVGPWAGGFTQTAFTIISDERHKTEPLEITDAMLDAASEVDWVRYKYIDRVDEKGPDGARWHFGAIAQRYVEAFERNGLDPYKFGFICYDEWDDQYIRVTTNEGAFVTKNRIVKRPAIVTKTRIVAKPVMVTEYRDTLVDSELPDGTKIKKIVKEEYQTTKMEQVFIFKEDGSPHLNEDGSHMFTLEPVTEDVCEEYEEEVVEEVVEEYEEAAEPEFMDVLEIKAGYRYGIRYEEALALEAALQRRNFQRLQKRIEALEAN